MQLFAYEARNDSGELIGGVIKALNMNEAGRMLGDNNLYVVKIGPARDNSIEAQTSEKIGSGGRGIKRKDVMWFTSQLAIMIETGINLSEALDCIARQCTDERAKPVFEAIAAGVREGRSLSDTMDSYPAAFPKTMRSLILASEMSGTMSVVLNRIAVYLQKEQMLLARTRGAMIYPLFMFGICLAVTVFLLTVILPRFATIFASRGAALPLPTQLLMSASDMLVLYAFWWIGGVISVIAGLWWAMRTDRGRLIFDWLILHSPIIGMVFRMLYQARSTRTLGTLIQAGVPLVDSLEVVCHVTPNIYFQRLWRSVNQRVSNGETLAAPLHQSPLIPESIAQMIDSGDRAGRLGPVLERLAEYIEDEYDQVLRTATQMIEPLMIGVIGGIVGFVVIALLLPLFSVSTVIAN